MCEKGEPIMILIESPKNEEITTLIRSLPADSYNIVEPKFVDSSQIIQLIVDVSKIVLPSAIAAASAYFVAKRTNTTIRFVFKPSNALEAEIKVTLSNRQLKDNQVYNRLVQLLTKIAQGEDNETDN
jgi:hypothetical protein